MKVWARLRATTVAVLTLAAAVAMSAYYDGDIKIDRANNGKTLTVRYTGTKAALAELRINGKSVATRKLDVKSDAGETNFEIATATLEDGDNNAEVRLLDANGKVLATQRSVVTVDRSANGPVYLLKPKSGATVQGHVEISVGFKVEMKNAYVSFFIDNEFVALKNYPPYTFLWDTSKIDNGWHEVQAWIVDKSNDTFKTQRMRVFVNNPSGRTERQTTPADPEPLTASGNTVKPTVGGAQGTKAGAAKTQDAGTIPISQGSTMALIENPIEGTIAKSNPTKGSTTASGAVMGTRTMKPTGTRGGTHGTPIAEASVPSKPEYVEATVTMPTAVKPTVAPAVKPAALPKIAVTYGTRLPVDGPFSLAIDGQTVKFDVRPRVEDGIALTPFRHLFEHMGGKVEWQAQEKVVRGTGLGDDLWFQVGKLDAHYGSQTIGLERASFIEAGRAILPISFLQAALGFEVQYDRGTGHVLVTAAKKSQ